MEEAFRLKLKEDRNSVNLNSVCFSKQKYDEVVKKVIQARSKTKNKLPVDYKLLKKYDILEIDGMKKLTVPSKDCESNIVCYVHDEELFRILSETHVRLEHAGRDKMMKELRKKYKNVTYKDIMMFLNLCKQCTKKYKHEKKDAERSASNKLNSKSQINLIDFGTYPDGEFKFVLIYQELSTKFCILKPLRSYGIQEIVNNLIDVFTLLGPPTILESDQNDNFIKSIVDTVKVRWNNLQITYVKSDEPSERIDDEIENMITTWMRDNNTSRWSEGLRFVQLRKNTNFHPALNKSPYDALFKRSLNFGHTLRTTDENDSVLENVIEPEIVWKTEPLDEEYQEVYDEYDKSDELTKQEMEVEITADYKAEQDDQFSENVCEICGSYVEDDGTCNICPQDL